jgi:putative ABC transport system ATP-binding protein
MELLSKLHHQGRTIVMVTHEDEIANYADRIIRFLDGRIDKDELNGNHKGRKAMNLVSQIKDEVRNEGI